MLTLAVSGIEVPQILEPTVIHVVLPKSCHAILLGSKE